MRGKKIVTIYYVIVLALAITSLILIRPEKPPEPECTFKFKYQGKKFKPTDEVKFLSANNYFKVATYDMDIIGFMVLDAKAKCTTTDFFNAVTKEAMKIGADYAHLTSVQRYMVTHTYGWAIGTSLAGGNGTSLGKQEEVIEKRFIYYFALYKEKEASKWPKDSGN